MAGVATATVNHRISLGNTRYMYLGTLALDNEYATGGNTFATAAGSRFSLPEKLQFLQATGSGYVTELAAASKLKVFRQKDPAAAGGADIALPEVASKADLSGVTAMPFQAVGS